jgi:hypothetical protein
MRKPSTARPGHEPQTDQQGPRKDPAGAASDPLPPNSAGACPDKTACPEGADSCPSIRANKVVLRVTKDGRLRVVYFADPRWLRQ